jgi:flagellar basal-body rod modification protein FlgD
MSEVKNSWFPKSKTFEFSTKTYYLMASIDPIASATTRQPTVLDSKTFSQVDFLKVIVTQLAQQDPFKAGDSNKIIQDFMSMANFQAVQESSSISKSIKSLDEYNLARSLLGTAVEVQGSQGALLPGFVQRVQVGDNGLTVTVNGVEYPLDRVRTMNVPPTNVPTNP